MIRDSYPSLRWLRVFSPGNGMVYIYTCDEMLDLSTETIESLKSFLDVMGMAHLKHEIKHYFSIKEDKVPSLDPLPPLIKELAMTSGLNAAGIKKSITETFPFLDPTYLKIEQDNEVFNAVFRIQPGQSLSEKQLFVFEKFLPELLPLGVKVKLENY
jgi:hypothetical protein